MTNMRAKVRVTGVEKLNEIQEKLSFTAVAKSDGYSDDGNDENNTYAKFSPSANFEITIANPNLIGKFEVNKEYYVDFTPVK